MALHPITEMLSAVTQIEDVRGEKIRTAITALIKSITSTYFTRTTVNSFLVNWKLLIILHCLLPARLLSMHVLNNWH